MYDMMNNNNNLYGNYNNYGYVNQSYEYMPPGVGIIGHPLSFMSNIAPINPLNPMGHIPSSMLRSTNDPRQAGSLGFQMNPVSKNKKK